MKASVYEEIWANEALEKTEIYELFRYKFDILHFICLSAYPLPYGDVTKKCLHTYNIEFASS